jgi:hypothetical protein
MRIYATSRTYHTALLHTARPYTRRALINYLRYGYTAESPESPESPVPGPRYWKGKPRKIIYSTETTESGATHEPLIGPTAVVTGRIVMRTTTLEYFQDLEHMVHLLNHPGEFTCHQDGIYTEKLFE